MVEKKKEKARFRRGSTPIVDVELRVTTAYSMERTTKDAVEEYATAHGFSNSVAAELLILRQLKKEGF